MHRLSTPKRLMTSGRDSASGEDRLSGKQTTLSSLSATHSSSSSPPHRPLVPAGQSLSRLLGAEAPEKVAWDPPSEMNAMWVAQAMTMLWDHWEFPSPSSQ